MTYQFPAAIHGGGVWREHAFAMKVLNHRKYAVD